MLWPSRDRQRSRRPWNARTPIARAKSPRERLADGGDAASPPVDDDYAPPPWIWEINIVWADDDASYTSSA